MGRAEGQRETPQDQQSQTQLAERDKTERLPDQNAAEWEQWRRKSAEREEEVGNVRLSNLHWTRAHAYVCVCVCVVENLLSHYQALFPYNFFKALRSKCQPPPRPETSEEKSVFLSLSNLV